MQLLRKQRTGKKKPVALNDHRESDRGEKSSEFGEAMSQQELLEGLEQLNEEFKEFEKIREGIKTRISSIIQLIPELTARKQLLQKDIDEGREGIRQLEKQFPVLHKQREDLLHSIPQKEEQKALLEKEISLEQDKVKKVKRLITTLARERTKIEKIMQQNQVKMRKITDQIEQIKSVQKYGVALISTGVYASQQR